MKTKNFRKILEKRLNKDEIAEIETQALLEVKILRYTQHMGFSKKFIKLSGK